MWAAGRRRSQGIGEYALITALAAILGIAGLFLFGPSVTNLLTNLGTSV